MKNLPVPLFLQPRDKPWCGPACASMLLAYYGISKPIEEIADSLPMSDSGIGMWSLGTFFIDNGFDTIIKTWHKNWFPNGFVSSGKINFGKLLRPGSAARRREIPRMKKYIRMGGKIVPAPVSLAEIQAAVKSGSPPILNLDNSAILSYARWGDWGHYVIPVACNDATITLNDPSSRHGGVNTYPKEFVMYACYVWHAGALFIRPKR